MSDESPPPNAAPDMLRGMLLDRLTCMIDAALLGSISAATRIANTLQGYVPDELLSELMIRCQRAKARRS